MKTNSKQQTLDLGRGFVVASVLALVGFAALAPGSACGQQENYPSSSSTNSRLGDGADQQFYSQDRGQGKTTKKSSKIEKPSTVVTTEEDVVSAVDRRISLREAIAYAKDGDTITFDSAKLNGKTIVVDSERGELVVNKSITIDASNLRSSSNGITLDGDGKTRILKLTSRKSLEIKGVDFVRGYSKSNGGALYNSSGQLVLSDCNATECHSDGDGGAVYSSGQLSLVNCNISDNVSFGNGGGLFAYGGQAQFASCVVERNDSRNNGGGVYVNGAGGARMNDCQIVDNVAYFAGGGIYLAAKRKATLSSCAISGNATNGDEMRANIRTGEIVEIAGNAVEEPDERVGDADEEESVGGGIYVGMGAELETHNCEIVGNEAVRSSDVYVFVGSTPKQPNGVARAYNTTSSFVDWSDGSSGNLTPTGAALPAKTPQTSKPSRTSNRSEPGSPQYLSDEFDKLQSQGRAIFRE